MEQLTFDEYRGGLSEKDGLLLDNYFAQVSQHIRLPRREKQLMLQDFEQALLYYHGAGLPLADALQRLAPENLGGFYARPPICWYPLDSAAKIYPLSMRHGQMAVFRLAANLREPVVPQLLQMALTFAVKRFPSFATTVKKGVFWHYLDTARRRYAVGAEQGLPCQPLPVGRSGSQSFRVCWYANRIGVEFFHILTDGTGGMQFLRTLLAEYFRLRGVDCLPEDSALSCNETPQPRELENAFALVDKPGRASGFTDKPAVQLSGALSAVSPCQVLHFRLDAAALTAAARGRSATVTAYLLALLFLAGRYATDELNGEMSIQVPVNMRRYYPSPTVRNFAMYCGIRLPVEQLSTVEEILPEITRQLQVRTGRQAMDEMVHSTGRLVRLLRWVPLAVKAPVARIVYDFLGDSIFSNTLSNLGKVQLPSVLEQQVESMDFVLGTALTNRVSCALVTCGEVATLSVSKMTADPSFEEKLAALLQAEGLAARIEGSVLYEG